jgi:Short C-terminal domain
MQMSAAQQPPAGAQPDPAAARTPDSVAEAAGLAANPDVSTALLRLAELKQAGLLTDDEFATAKAQALGT